MMLVSVPPVCDTMVHHGSPRKALGGSWSLRKLRGTRQRERGSAVMLAHVRERAMVAVAMTVGLASTRTTGFVRYSHGFVRPMVVKGPSRAVSSTCACTSRSHARSRSHLCSRRSSGCVGLHGRRHAGSASGESSGEGGDGWDSWEFGSFKLNSFEELTLERHMKDQPSSKVPSIMGGGADLLEKAMGDKTMSADLERAIDILKGYVTHDRVAKMREVLAQRTSSAAVVFENPSNPNNVWACLRTLDSFGVQHAHVVSDPRTYSKKARRQTMCTAMGSQKWLTLHGHDTTEDAVAKLKADGYQVVASDLSPSAVPIDEIDWSKRSAIVLGNEERGISNSMRSLADATFAIPMRGFAQSFNMSVACSIILAHLSALRALRHGDLTEDERRKITAGWLLQCVRGSDGILRRHGIVVSEEVFGKPSSRKIAGYSAR